jgi:hypothetical protein
MVAGYCLERHDVRAGWFRVSGRAWQLRLVGLQVLDRVAGHLWRGPILAPPPPPRVQKVCCKSISGRAVLADSGINQCYISGRWLLAEHTLVYCTCTGRQSRLWCVHSLVYSAGDIMLTGGVGG